MLNMGKLPINCDFFPTAERFAPLLPNFYEMGECHYALFITT
jgi:hypothetical protein